VVGLFFSFPIRTGSYDTPFNIEENNNTFQTNYFLLCLQGEFVEDGTETHFTLGDLPAYIKAVTSGKRREGIIHSLIVNNTVIPEINER
jgi:hypothetical protein